MKLDKPIMDKINLFDANVHLTVDGSFLDYKNNMPANYLNYAENNKYYIKGINLVGLPTIGGYKLDSFINIFDELPSEIEKYLTIPWLHEYDNKKFTNKEMEKINCIKIHPRLLNRNINDINWQKISNICMENNKVIGICTYLKEKTEKEEIEKYKKIVDKLLNKNNKIIFFHAFSNYFLEFWNKYKKDNVMFETSFSLIRNNNLLDNYISAINEKLPSICYGSDYPDYTLKNYEENINIILNKTSIDSAEYFMLKNISMFLK